MDNQRKTLEAESDNAARALGESIDDLQAAIRARVTDAKESVQHVVRDVKKTAHELSPVNNIRKHPWLFVGGAAVGGFLIVGGSRTRVAYKTVQHAGKASSRLGSILASLFNEFRPELKILKGALLSGGARMLANKLRDRKPELQQEISYIEQMIVDRTSQA